MTFKTKLFLEGDRSKAICSHCEGLVNTTFCRREVPFESGKGSVKDLLVAVCDVCGSIVATPAQSTPAIHEARRKAVKPIEAQLPAIYLDALDLAAHTIDQMSTTEFRKVLMTLYLHRYASGEYPAKELVSVSSIAKALFKERRGETRRRLSLKVTQHTADDLKALLQTTRMSQTEIIKSVIYKIQSDVLDIQKPSLMRELRTLAIVAA
ncbi:hypothetical protein [Bordetella sp. LUAb4]|uniref:hypothetical protein n=1 Tax=Bordetella sp. LUAb4 TaxID=2843195 RepID=UPI001E4AF149|nr:hypothetical protein [Bordetella sp. LUAb4]